MPTIHHIYSYQTADSEPARLATDSEPVSIESILTSSSLSEILHVGTAVDGHRDINGEWIEPDPVFAPVRGIAHPMDGEERLLVPEGLRGEEVVRFYLPTAVNVVVVGDDNAGTIVRYDNTDYRARVREVRAQYVTVFGVAPVQASTV